MKVGHYWTQKVRYYSNVTGINLLALLFLWYALSPLFLHHASATVFSPQANTLRASQAVKPDVKVISGVPARITIPSLNIDLPVEPGQYDTATNTWTLHDLKAYYAIYSAPANNIGGNTFLYGHNNYQTLGAIKSITPGTVATVYTVNGHIFDYSFDSYTFVQPDDLSVFSYQGKPILTVQTCTGVWNETRGMFKFNLLKVEQ